MALQEDYKIKKKLGYTCKGGQMLFRPPDKSRIDYFLISESLYNSIPEGSP